MLVHVVQGGEYIEFIAHRYGTTPASLWELPRNKALRDVRSGSSILCAGDLLDVPEPIVRSADVSPGESAKFQAFVPKTRVAVRFNRGTDALANEPYELTAGSFKLTGSSDGTGLVSAMVPVEHRTATIHLKNADLAYTLELGGLDPITEMSGVKGRLALLGYYQGAIDGTDHPLVAVALRRFQEDQKDKKLLVTGEADPDTRKALVDAFGC